MLVLSAMIYMGTIELCYLYHQRGSYLTSRDQPHPQIHELLSGGWPQEKSCSGTIPLFHPFTQIALCLLVSLTIHLCYMLAVGY